MARPQWPVELNPLPLRDGYSFRPHDDILRSDVPGHQRARRLHGESDLFPTLRLPMSSAQLAIWQAFWRDDLSRGLRWFDMAVRIGPSLDTRVVRARSYETQASDADWIVTMEIEVRDATYPMTGGIYLAGLWGDEPFEGFVTGLGEFVHVEWPTYFEEVA